MDEVFVSLPLSLLLSVGVSLGNISYVIYDDKDNLGPISHVGRARTAYNLHECVMTGHFASSRLPIAFSLAHGCHVIR